MAKSAEPICGNPFVLTSLLLLKRKRILLPIFAAMSEEGAGVLPSKPRGKVDFDFTAAPNSGSLNKPEVLRAQTERLLNDPKSQRFVDDFTNQ